MLNTTTIPTVMPNIVPSVWTSLGYGLFLAMPFIVGIIRKLSTYTTDESDDSETDEETEEEAEAEEIKNKYLAEYTALADRPTEDIEDKMVLETTEHGDLIMTYDKTTETFWYYTNNLKDVQYPLLEAVARKFVVEHNCKRLYKGLAEEAVAPAEAVASAEAVAPAEASALAPAAKSLFATFKKYNTGSKGAAHNFNTRVKVIEQANHFRYKGKLYHYEETLKEKTEKTKLPELDYAAYKELLLTKIKN